MTTGFVFSVILTWEKKKIFTSFLSIWLKRTETRTTTLSHRGFSRFFSTFLLVYAPIFNISSYKIRLKKMFFLCIMFVSFLSIKWSENNNNSRKNVFRYDIKVFFDSIQNNNEKKKCWIALEYDVMWLKKK